MSKPIGTDEMLDRIEELEAKLAQAVEALQVFADDANWFDTPDGDGVTMNATWRGLIYAPELFARDVIEKLTGDRRMTDTTREAPDYLVKKLRLWDEVWPEDRDKPEGHLYEEAADRIEELETENKNLRHMVLDQIEGNGDDPEIMAASRAEWAARAKAAEAKLVKAVELVEHAFYEGDVLKSSSEKTWYDSYSRKRLAELTGQDDD